MKTIVLGAVLALAVAAPAHAACTMEQLQQKIMAFTTKYQEVAQKDGQKAQRFAPKAQEASKKFQDASAKGGTDYAEICKFYDELLVELDKS
jgi:hypothetical protein